MQIPRDFPQLEAVRLGERQHDVILGRRRLQLEVERAAEPLAQGETPRAVHPAAVGGVNHELHAPGLVEKALEDDRVERRQASQGGAPGGEVLEQLQRGLLVERDGFGQPLPRRPGPLGQMPLDVASQPGDGEGELIASSRRLSQPEWNRGWLSMCILDAHGAALDAQYSIRRVAQLEDVALQALDRKILVDCADQVPFRLEHDFIVGVVRNGASRGDRSEPASFARAKQPIDRIVMNQGAMAPASRAEALRQHADALVEFRARQITVAVRPAHQIEQLVFLPFARRHLGGNLLGQHVERISRHDEAVQFPASHGVHQCRAFHELVPRQREEPALGSAPDRVAGTPHALQKSIDRAGGTYLTNQVHIPDVDAEFQRGGRNQSLQLTALQTLLGVEAPVPRETSVVGGNVFLPDALRNMARDAFGQAAGIDEDDGRAMFANQFGQSIIDLRPHLARHHRLQRRGRKLQCEVAVARMAAVDDRAECIAVAHRTAVADADQEPRHLLDRLLCRR